MLLNGDAWCEFFDTFEREAWRFEAQPTYTMPREQENIARFLRGEDKPLGHNSRWHERVQGYKDARRSIGRVRVVRRPLTGCDWWMFDEGRIAHLNFRPDGTQINREAYEGDPTPYRAWKRIARERSVPFGEYVKGLGLPT